MPATESSAQTLRFSIFEVDLRAAELRKHGVRIKLQDQPFRILSLLLEHPGALVTREEIREELWRDHTFVDFDRSLNKAMAKLRSALGDSAECPRFIETIPRHGYRLIAPVIGGSPEAADAHSFQAPAGILQNEVPPAAAAASGSSASFIIEKPAQLFYSLTEGWSFSLVMAVIVTLAALAGVYSFRSNQPAIFGGASNSVNLRRSVAVLGFRNLSPDAREGWLSTAFSDWLTTELSAGEQLRTLPAENIARMKMEIPLEDLDSLGRDSLARIHKNLGTDLVVVGSYAALGGSTGSPIRLDLRLLDARSGETLYAGSETGSQADLFEVVSRAGEHLRSALGVRKITREEAAEVATALPSNHEAVRLYAEGLSKLRVFDALSARDTFEKAIAAEPDYALSHAALAAAWAQLGYDQNAVLEAKKAFDLSSNLPRADRLLAEARFREMSHDWTHAIVAYQALFGFYPDNPDYGLALANSQVKANRWKDALETVAALRALPAPLRDDPRIDFAEGDAARSLGDMKRAAAAMASAADKARAAGASLLVGKALLAQAWLLDNLGRMDEMDRAIHEAREVYVAAHDNKGVADCASMSAIALEVQGDYTGARKAYAESLQILKDTGNRLGSANEYNNLADVLFHLGDLPSAARSYAEALASYTEIGDQDGVALAKLGLGEVLLAQGRHAEAKQAYQDSLSISQQIGDRSREADALLGLSEVLQAEGDSPGAWESVSRARDIFQDLGDLVHHAQCHLQIAELLLDQGKYAEADAAARNAANLLTNAKSAQDRAAVSVTLSQVLLEQGKLPEARASLQPAIQFAALSHEEQIGFVSQILASRLATHSANASERQQGMRRLDELATQARRAGYQFASMQARLALAESEAGSAERDRGHARLVALRQDALSSGFVLIARQAGAALQGPNPSTSR